MTPKGTHPNPARLLGIVVRLLPHYEIEKLLVGMLEVLMTQGKGSSLAIY